MQFTTWTARATDSDSGGTLEFPRCRRRPLEGEDRARTSSRQAHQRWQGAGVSGDSVCRAAGRRSALEGAAACGEMEGRARRDEFWRALRKNHVFDDMIFQDSGPSEDCLYLNVYAPADASSQSGCR